MLVLYACDYIFDFLHIYEMVVHEIKAVALYHKCKREGPPEGAGAAAAEAADNAAAAVGETAVATAAFQKLLASLKSNYLLICW